MTVAQEPGEAERVSKLIARAGVASRREAERLIEAGEVEVNGEVVYHPGTAAISGTDHIRVKGIPLPAPAPKVYYAAYKPRGMITTRDDPDGRKSVVELVEDLGVRIEPVGRLDFNTEGLLLFTNDGELAHKLTHPSSEVPKRYRVKVWKEPDAKALKRLQRGIYLEDGKTRPARIRVLDTTESGNVWLEITVTEGRNRLVRRMMEAIGHPVSKLRRESFATISLGRLERGQIRPLSGQEIQRLKDLGEGKRPERAGKGKYKKGYARPKPKKTRPGSKKRGPSKR